MSEKNEILKYISKRIYEIRKERKISGTKMALDLGLSNSYITIIENMQRTPSLEVFIDICDYMNISLTEFFSKFYLDSSSSNDSYEQNTNNSQTISKSNNISSFISKRIYDIRINKNISIKLMSKKLGFSHNYITQIETGTQLPTLNELVKICDFFKISVSTFFNPFNAEHSEEIIEDLGQPSIENLIDAIQKLSNEHLKMQKEQLQEQLNLQKKQLQEQLQEQLNLQKKQLQEQLQEQLKEQKKQQLNLIKEFFNN